MKILKSLNNKKFYFSLIFFTFFLQFSTAEDSIDIWNLENKSEKKISEKDILGDNEEEDDSIYESNLKKKNLN